MCFGSKYIKLAMLQYNNSGVATDSWSLLPVINCPEILQFFKFPNKFIYKFLFVGNPNKGSSWALIFGSK
jgi:hypothetical protein